MANVPQILVGTDGRCVYASAALATLLQCGLHELYGDGWRVRLSPYADTPWDLDRVIRVAKTKKAIHLNHPTGDSSYVTRLHVVTDPEHPETVTGFFGRVQLVRVHRRVKAESA